MSQSSRIPPFDPTDPLGLDDLLDPEDLGIRDTVRAWAADRVLPYVADWYEKGSCRRSGSWPGSSGVSARSGCR